MARRFLWLAFIVVAIVVASAPDEANKAAPSAEEAMLDSLWARLNSECTPEALAKLTPAAQRSQKLICQWLNEQIKLYTEGGVKLHFERGVKRRGSSPSGRREKGAKRSAESDMDES